MRVQNLSYRRLWGLVWPASLAAMIGPLLGVVDAVVLARSARPLDIGAVGLAAAIFSVIYWTLGFLRLTMAGLTAQAVGAGDEKAARRVLLQGCFLSLVLGLLLLVGQAPLGSFTFSMMTQGAAVAGDTETSARSYYDIRIWGAPFAVIGYTSLGWITAKGRTDLLLGVSAVTIGLNIVLDIYFVSVLEMGAEGVAYGTLIAEVMSFFAALAAITHLLHRHGGLKAHWPKRLVTRDSQIARTLSVNFDNFIRTAILVATFTHFIKKSAVYGDVVLSANQVLLQVFLVTGLALDGMAIAAETVVGQAVGRRHVRHRIAEFTKGVRRLAALCLGAAGMLVVFLFVFKQPLIDFLVPEAQINQAVQEYYIWTLVSPLIVAVAFLLDGVFIGATWSKPMRNSMMAAGATYIVLIIVLPPVFGNHGLWVAFLGFMAARGVFFLIPLRGYRQRLAHATHNGLTP